MDLVDVREVRIARARPDLDLRPGEAPLGGGTWLYSEPQPGTTGLVDLTAMGWTPITASEHGLEIAATCTLAELAAWTPASAPASGMWPAITLFAPAVDSLLASWKIHRFATVGGNLCTALPAGSMTSLLAGLDGVAVIWGPGGAERRMPVSSFVTGVRRTALAPGEVLRAIEVPATALASRAAMRRLSLAELGRSGVFVVGRRDGAGLVITVTASTDRPWRFAFAAMPSAAQLHAAVDAVDRWYDDPHGAPDWRRAMTLRLAEELRVELGDGTDGPSADPPDPSLARNSHDTPGPDARSGQAGDGGMP